MQSHPHLLTIHCRQRIEQIIHIEADFQPFAFVGNFNLLLGFFLFRVVRLDYESVLFQLEANPTIFLIGENGGSL